MNEARKTEGFGSNNIAGSERPQIDVIQGWETRSRHYNSVGLDSLVPFVQLIGLYNTEEINRLIRKPEILDRRAIYVDEFGNDMAWDESNEETEDEIIADQNRFFNEKIRDKYIQINIKNYNQKDDELYTPGIVLATNSPQVGNKAAELYDNNLLPKDSGGVGITDLQIETGTKDFMNRRYKLRLTVTDPLILNDSPEYLKLSTLQSQFLLIHGWSNPNQIEGMDRFDAPPAVTHIGAEGFPNGRMSVDLTNQNTGGMWSATTVAITMFDFAFNEIGQLEASFTFMPREISYAATYRINLVSPTTKLFLGTGEEIGPVDTDNPTAPKTTFAGLLGGFGSVGSVFGQNLADVIYEEQQAYIYNDDAIAGLFSNLDELTDFSVADTLRNFSERLAEWDTDLGTTEEQQNNQKIAEGTYRFPYAGPGIRVYDETEREIKDPDDITKKITIKQKKSTIVYYYLGWLMEAVRFSMWDINKNKVKNGQKPFDLKFKYYPIPEDSQFNLAFQDNIRAQTQHDVAGIITEMIAKFKEQFTPMPRYWNPLLQEVETVDTDFNELGQRVKGEGIGVEINPITAVQINEPDSVFANEILLSPGRFIRGSGLKHTGESFGLREDRRDPSRAYGIVGNTSDFIDADYQNLTRFDKFLFLADMGAPVRTNAPAGSITQINNIFCDYRITLAETDAADPAGEGFVRIMHPDFEGQLLYDWRWLNYIPIDSEQKAEKAGWTKDVGNGPHGAGQPVLGTSSQRGKGWIYSKVNNFFVGEFGGAINDKAGPNDSDYREYIRNTNNSIGIIMPAISARYYTPAKYEYTQQKWYNKHIGEFIFPYFSNLIRERVTEVLSRGGNIEEIKYEPIDLFWLTGRRYDHKLPRLVRYTNSYPGGPGSTIANYKYDSNPQKGYNNCIIYQRPDGIWPLEEIKDKIDNIILDETALDNEHRMEKLRQQQELQGNFNRELNGAPDGEDELRNSYEYTMGTSSLNSMESNQSRYSTAQVYNQAIFLASSIKEYTGLNGELNFWKGQLSKVLVEIYNKDLINVSPDQVTPDVREGYTAQTTAGRMAFLATETPADNNGREQIVNCSATHFGNIQSRDDAYELIFYMEYNPYPEGRPGPDISWADWGRIRNVEFPDTLNGRYLKVFYQNFDRYPLNETNIGILGDIDVNTLSGIEYLYVNFFDSWMKDQWTNGHAVKEAADNNDFGAGQAILQATSSYRRFIKYNRELALYYLKKVNELKKEIATPTQSVNKLQSQIDEIENEQRAVDLMIEALNLDDLQEISPFSGINPLDSPVSIPRGGGRYLHLSTVAAQQWALRFDRRTVFGASDVRNYRIKRGGNPVVLPGVRNYGWPYQPPSSWPHQRAGSSPWPWGPRASLKNWIRPKTILNFEKLGSDLTYEWKGNSYNMRGARGNPSDWLNGQPNALIWNHPQYTSQNRLWPAHPDEPELGSRSNPLLLIDWLVRAGVVDTDLIKEILLHKFGWDNVGFADDENVEQQIVGYWPVIDQYAEGVADLHPGMDGYPIMNYTGPMYLVDEDLDFVIQAKNLVLEDSFDDDGYYNKPGLVFPERYHADDWLKVWDSIGAERVASGIFGPAPDGLTKVYPNHPFNDDADATTYDLRESKPLAQGDHLPNLDLSIVRQLVNDHDIDPVVNPYNSAGYPGYSPTYPYGIPEELNVVGAGTSAAKPGINGKGVSLSEWNVDFDIPVGSGTWKDWKKTGVCVNDILNTLPDAFERGFFSSVAYADVDYNGGAELNPGIVDYIVRDFMQLFNGGRRIAKRSDDAPTLNNLAMDVTYGDLLLESEKKSTKSMADFSNQKITNVAEIPIKRDVVENLLNKRNSNMSLLQFFQQILSPSAIALNGNVQLGVRNTNGIIDIIPASISYKQQTTDFFREQLDAAIDATGHPVEMNHLLFEYKKRNSLIESIDMSSKMDPAAFLTYQNYSDFLMGRDYNVLKLLSYEGVAEDFMEFLDNTPKADNSGQTYSGIITVGQNNTVRVNKVKFNELPSSIVDSMIAQNPERWATITATMQAENNFTTELLAFYMRSVTLTIHGTTNLQPFNLINVSGVMPDLEGIYIITNLTEKVTPTTFQTIIEGKLLKRKRISDGVYI